MILLINLTGLLLVLCGLTDMLLTILHYEGYGFFSRLVQRSIWRTIKALTSLFPAKSRVYLRSMGAPLMIIGNLAFWLGIQLVGFTFFYWAGMESNNFAFSGPQPQEEFTDALYFSSVTLPTLGFGDIVPLSLPYKFMATIEALLGFSIVTLSITYVLGVYRVIQQFRIISSFLYNESGNTGNVWRIIKIHYRNPPDNSYYRELHRSILDWYEGFHQSRLAYYFYSTRPYLSIPSTFSLLGELLAIMRFGFHPALRKSSPAFISLVEGYTSIIDAIRNQIPIRKKETTQKPLTFEHFSRAISGKSIEDYWLRQFCIMIKRVHLICKKKTDSDLYNLYSRYTQWLTFMSKVQVFTKDISEDLAHP